MIMLLATAAEVSQQDAPLKVRPTQLVLLRTDLRISGNELARYRMRSCTSRGVRSGEVPTCPTAIALPWSVSINVRQGFPWPESGSALMAMGVPGEYGQLGRVRSF